ncbi:phosphatidylglycerophosphatase and protein-tyrosine phosphatase 1 isoform X2 [Phyllopteryx taeniolatus]|uniref:phosphatidylglycerophosphatase and protein-tyrosine phosphatase 1 isoform X2 n=1 Tax=Phyllopteryx taeniolatus TaxID=161469 RepID=UPI002AD366F2|nr:phosphatidylglycerophosphatase and protein-tyrosine phosphatase 1 isoform X2 [Phyllopteryx taeniolatus]
MAPTYSQLACSPVVCSKQVFDEHSSTFSVFFATCPSFFGTSYGHKILVETENVRGVITMNENYETKHFCNSAEEWQAAGVEQLRLSTVDLTGVPSLENLHRGVEFALQHREKGNSVYVHCKAGRSRSATLAAAYLIRLHCCTPEEACQKLVSVRPHILVRTAQLEMLRKYHLQVCRKSQ